MTTPFFVTDELASDLCEIIEALGMPGMTNCTAQLVETVERLESSISRTDIKPLLDKAVHIFNGRKGRHPQSFLFSRDQAADELAARLKSRFPGWPYFVYHGTTSKALPSILEHGIVPAGGKSSWEGTVNESYLSRGVFLTGSWRGAVSWAQVTALTRTFQLRKDGSVPAIIRIKASDMELAADDRPSQRDCFVHAGVIDVSEADCFAFSEPDGKVPANLPDWSTIAETIKMFPGTGTQRNTRAKPRQASAPETMAAI